MSSLPDDMFSPEPHEWRSNDPDLVSSEPKPRVIPTNPLPQNYGDVMDLFQEYVKIMGGEFRDNGYIAEVEKKCRTIMDQLEVAGYTIAAWSNPSREIITLPSGEQQTVIVIHYEFLLLQNTSPDSQLVKPIKTVQATARIFGQITPAPSLAPPDDISKKDSNSLPQKDIDWLEQNLSWLDEKKP